MIEVGDKVRIDIPDKDDPDHRYHREQGEIVDIIEDSAGLETGDERDDNLYRVQIDSGERSDFRWRDIRLLK